MAWILTLRTKIMRLCFKIRKKKKSQVEKKMPRIIYVITLRVRKKSRPFVFWENLWQANLLSVEYHLYAERKDLFDGLFPWKLHLFGPILRPDWITNTQTSCRKKKFKAKYSQTRSANAKCKKMPVVCLQFFLLHPRKTEGPWAYSRYTGSSARAEGPTFLPLCRVSHIERGKVNWLWQRDRLRFSISNL